MSKIRFVDPGIVVNATGAGGSGGSSISSSYALSASYADFATSASYAVSASHEIIKEISSSYADTASFAQSGNGIFSGIVWTGEKSIELGLADAMGSIDYVAREIIKAENIVDFTAKQGLAERFAKRFGQVIFNIFGGAESNLMLYR